MQVWCQSDHVYCQKVGLPRRHFRHGENGSRLRFLEISRKIPRYRAKNTVLGTYRRNPLDFRARRHPNLKGGMYSSPEIHGFSPRRISVRCFSDFSTDTDFRHGAHVAAGVPLFGSRTGPMGMKLAHVQFNSTRSIFSRRRALDLLRYHPLPC